MTKPFRTYGSTRDDRVTSEIEVYDKQDIEIVRGNDITLHIILETIDLNSAVGRYDLTDAVIYFTARKEPTLDVVITKHTPSADIVITDAVQGEFELTIQRNDTKALNTGQYSYDIEVINAAGETYTPVMGRLQIIQNITSRS